MARCAAFLHIIISKNRNREPSKLMGWELRQFLQYLIGGGHRFSVSVAPEFIDYARRPNIEFDTSRSHTRASGKVWRLRSGGVFNVLQGVTMGGELVDPTSGAARLR